MSIESFQIFMWHNFEYMYSTNLTYEDLEAESNHNALICPKAMEPWTIQSAKGLRVCEGI